MVKVQLVRLADLVGLSVLALSSRFDGQSE